MPRQNYESSENGIMDDQRTISSNDAYETLEHLIEAGAVRDVIDRKMLSPPPPSHEWFRCIISRNENAFWLWDEETKHCWLSAVAYDGNFFISQRRDFPQNFSPDIDWAEQTIEGRSCIAVLRADFAEATYQLFLTSCENCDDRLGLYSCIPSANQASRRSSLPHSDGTSDALNTRSAKLNEPDSTQNMKDNGSAGSSLNGETVEHSSSTIFSTEAPTTGFVQNTKQKRSMRKVISSTWSNLRATLLPYHENDDNQSLNGKISPGARAKPVRWNNEEETQSSKKSVWAWNSDRKRENQSPVSSISKRCTRCGTRYHSREMFRPRGPDVKLSKAKKEEQRICPSCLAQIRNDEGVHLSPHLPLRQLFLEVEQWDVHLHDAVDNVRCLKLNLPRLFVDDYTRAVWCIRNPPGHGTGWSVTFKPDLETAIPTPKSISNTSMIPFTEKQNQSIDQPSLDNNAGAADKTQVASKTSHINEQNSINNSLSGLTVQTNFAGGSNEYSFSPALRTNRHADSEALRPNFHGSYSVRGIRRGKPRLRVATDLLSPAARLPLSCTHRTNSIASTHLSPTAQTPSETTAQTLNETVTSRTHTLSSEDLVSIGVRTPQIEPTQPTKSPQPIPLRDQSLARTDYPHHTNSTRGNETFKDALAMNSALHNSLSFQHEIDTNIPQVSSQSGQISNNHRLSQTDSAAQNVISRQSSFNSVNSGFTAPSPVRVHVGPPNRRILTSAGNSKETNVNLLKRTATFDYVGSPLAISTTIKSNVAAVNSAPATPSVLLPDTHMEDASATSSASASESIQTQITSSQERISADSVKNQHGTHMAHSFATNISNFRTRTGSEACYTNLNPKPSSLDTRPRSQTLVDTITSHDSDGAFSAQSASSSIRFKASTFRSRLQARKGIGKDIFTVESRVPRYNVNLGAFTMRFVGSGTRVVESSSKNFILDVPASDESMKLLVSCLNNSDLTHERKHLTSDNLSSSSIFETPHLSPSAASHASDYSDRHYAGNTNGTNTANQQKSKSSSYISVPILQFGKLSRHRYSCDFRYPISPLHAFASALTVFQWLPGRGQGIKQDTPGEMSYNDDGFIGSDSELESEDTDYRDEIAASSTSYVRRNRHNTESFGWSDTHYMDEFDSEEDQLTDESDEDNFD